MQNCINLGNVTELFRQDLRDLQRYVNHKFTQFAMSEAERQDNKRGILGNKAPWVFSGAGVQIPSEKI
jgi:hypothetical protein